MFAVTRSNNGGDFEPLINIDDEEVAPIEIDDKEVRIVLVGKTGSGKSATGNTILGSKAFESKFQPTSVTQDCVEKRADVADKKVSVVDTPGVFETNLSENKTHDKLIECIELSAPGPHVFLVAMQLGRFTEEDKKAMKFIESAFGKKSSEYTMILFTHGDQLEGTPVEEFLENSPELKECVDKCGGGYHVFNNKTQDRTQVTELLEKINTMLLKNEGKHYTNEMFQKAQKKKAIQNIKSTLGAAILPASITVTSGVGIAVGIGIEAATATATAGSVIGPLGAAVGCAVGGVVGLAVGVGINIYENHKNKAK